MIGLIAVAACTDRPVVIGRSVKAYSLADRDYAALHGLRAEIVGNPFEGPTGELEAVVGEALVDQHFGPPFRRVVIGTGDLRSPYRVVLAFQPAHGYANLCERAPKPAPVGARIEVHAAFCAADQLLTSTRGSVARVGRPSDRAFRDLMSMIGFELFPPSDERTGGGDFMVP